MDSWLWIDRGISWRSCRLRRLRFKRDTRAATEIQRMARGMLGRRRRQRELQLRAQREQDAAALKVAGAAVVVIQRFARGWLARRLAGRLRTELRPEDRHFQKVRRTTFGAHDRICSFVRPLHRCFACRCCSRATPSRSESRRGSCRNGREDGSGSMRPRCSGRCRSRATSSWGWRGIWRRRMTLRRRRSSATCAGGCALAQSLFGRVCMCLRV